jgi:hypothetical protein
MEDFMVSHTIAIQEDITLTQIQKDIILQGFQNSGWSIFSPPNRKAFITDMQNFQQGIGNIMNDTFEELLNVNLTEEVFVSFYPSFDNGIYLLISFHCSNYSIYLFF